MNLEEVKASYKGKKEEEGKKDPWVHYVVRPLSFPLSTWCINKGIAANQVTLLGLGIGLVGCIFLAYGPYWAGISGAVLVNLYGLSDCVDGNIARATGKITEYGIRIDGASYLIITSVLFACIGIGTGYIILGLTASLIRMLRYAITYQHSLPSEPAKTNVLYKAGMFAITIRDPLLLVCAVTGTLYWFLLFYVVAHIGELGVISRKTFRR